MSSFSKSLRDKLSEIAKIDTLRLVEVESSEHDETEKFLFELHDGKFIESVLIPPRTAFKGPDATDEEEQKRLTLCVSTQVGCPLEDASSFAKYLGGSSANIAFGAARLGLKSAMISRVGDEQMGRFLVQTLQREGCDTQAVQVDPQRLTALVLLGLKDRDTFPLIFYRENCADMAIDAALIREDFIAQCRALLDRKSVV